MDNSSQTPGGTPPAPQQPSQGPSSGPYYPPQAPGPGIYGAPPPGGYPGYGVPQPQPYPAPPSSPLPPPYPGYGYPAAPSAPMPPYGPYAPPSMPLPPGMGTTPGSGRGSQQTLGKGGMGKVIAAVASLVTFAIAVTGFALTFHPFGIFTTTYTATQIIQKAKSAPLQDATGTAVLTDSAGDSVSGTISFTDNPSAYYWHLSGTTGGVTRTADYISIGGNTYERVYQGNSLPAGTKWTVSASGNPLVSIRSLNDLYTPFTNPTLVGKETINGADTYHLNQVIQEANDTVTADLWVRQDNFYPAKQIDMIASGTVTLTMTITYTDWDTGQKINAPPAGDVAP